MAKATIGELKVEIGADIRGLEREIRKAERAMQTATSNLSDLSRKLSLAVSVPLLGIGVGAIKAAGDLESLKLAMKATFEGAGRSAEEATAEVEKLRISAMAPGLDFEQAVKASIRLQAVGFSAEKARAVIEQLANTVASTGGTADDLGEVVNQFSQMIGKGKVFQDDLKIITGRMPVVARLMKEAFGTTTAEGLNQLGIDSREFVDVITKKMAELPRAMGGINNAIVNAFSAVKQAAASFGETLDKKLRITERLTTFADWVSGLADGFNQLSDSQQNFVIGVGVFSAALGPALKVGQAVAAMVIYMRSTFLELQKALLLSQTGGVGGLITKWKALDLAMKASYIGIAVGVVVALGVAMATLAEETGTAAKVSATLSTIEKTAASAASEERAKTSALIDVLRDENATREQKEGALRKLQEIAPKYFNNLKVETASVDALNRAYSGYIDSILRAARAKAAEEKLIELDKKAIEIAERKARITAENATSTDASRGGIGGSVAFDISAANAKKTFTNAVLEEEQAVKAQMDALIGTIKANTDFTATTDKATGSVKEFVQSTGEANKMTKTLKEVLSDISSERARQELLGAKDVTEEAQVIENGLKKLLDVGFAPTSKAVQDLRGQLKSLFNDSKIENFAPLPTLGVPQSVQSQSDNTPAGPKPVDTKGVEQFLSYSEKIGAVNTALQDGTIKFGEAFKQVSDLVTSQGSVMEQVFLGMGTAISEAAASGEASFKQLGLAAVASAAKIVRAYIQQGVAAAVAKALGSLPFPLNLAAGAAAGGLAAAAFTKAITAIGVPKFANGTNFAQGGLAMVGERGKEIVNLPRGSQVIPHPKTNDILGRAGGGVTRIEGEFVVSGDSLRLALGRANSKQIRVT